MEVKKVIVGNTLSVFIYTTSSLLGRYKGKSFIKSPGALSTTYTGRVSAIQSLMSIINT